MSKITKVKSGTTCSYKLTIPKALAEDYIEKYGNNVKISTINSGGFKIKPIKE